MGVNGLPWTPATKIWDFWANSDPLEGPGSHFKFGGKFKIFQIFHKLLQYGCLWTTMDTSNQDLTFLSWLRPAKGFWGPFQIWREIQICSTYSQIPVLWVSMDSPGHQQSGFDILSWLRTPRALRTPRVCGGHLVFFVSNPYNMGVYGLPWPPAIRIWHFELTQDP